MRPVVLIALLPLLAACGVATQSEAQRLPTALVTPTRAGAQPIPYGQRQQRLILWFVKDRSLVPEFSDLARDAGARSVIDALVKGPTTGDAIDGYRTLAADPVTGEGLVRVDSQGPGSHQLIRVQLSSNFASLASSEQVLLLGQVVLSLSDAGYGSVQFADTNNADVAVPLQNGSLQSNPVTLDDYRSLILGKNGIVTKSNVAAQRLP